MSAKQAINDKLQGNVAEYLKCRGVVNNQIGKVYCWVSVNFFKSVFGKVTSKNFIVSCTLSVSSVLARCAKCKNHALALAVIDRRLRPRCCHLGSYFKRTKSSPVHPLACNWYYCAQFIAKPKAACALPFSWAATSGNLGLWANITSSIKPEVHNVSLRY